MENTIIIGGGTFNPISNHFSLAAPAFGKTAKELTGMLTNPILYLTKMAESSSNIVTNKDLENLIDKILKLDDVNTIVMTSAVCDFEDPTGDRFDSRPDSTQNYTLELQPSDKIISKIRMVRPDIFLVGFKSTTGLSSDGQYYASLKMMKSSKCNLVFSNDAVTKNNMVIVPEESRYYEGTDRNESLRGLVRLIKARQNGTYRNTELTKTENFELYNTPSVFQEVVRFLVNQYAFISDNGNGFTPGHFCYKLNKDTFASSQRKANHNDVFKNGLTLVERENGKIKAYGDKKPSVGATSQQLLFDAHKDYDCIIHTHNPLKKGSYMNQISQHNYQCGSVECGENTRSGMTVNSDGILSVFLKQHGANIMFKSSMPLELIIDYIKNNLDLSKKIK